MKDSQIPLLSRFFVAGINYKKSDALTRSRFAVSTYQYEDIIKNARLTGAEAFFILSTCNRTEIYGFAGEASQLIELLCAGTSGDEYTFTESAYIKCGLDAVQHLFEVGAGLDSQILGDYEIVGQLKRAFRFAKEHGMTNSFLERLVNNVLKASKIIKNETALSCGTVSASFAAVQYIKENFRYDADTRILLVGTGKIGRSTCKNMVDYLGTSNITLVNRSAEKAAELALELGLAYVPISELGSQLDAADIILTATSAEEPAILKSSLVNSPVKLIIDLSVPNNVEPAVSTLPNVTLVNIDTLSTLKDKTLEQRRAEIPRAREIIRDQIDAFADWCRMLKNAPALKAIKSTLNEISAQEQFEAKSHGVCPLVKIEEKIQRIVNSIAAKMRSENQHGCYYLEAINEFVNQRTD